MSTKVLILRVSNETLLYCINYYVYLEVSMETPLCKKLAQIYDTMKEKGRKV